MMLYWYVFFWPAAAAVPKTKKEREKGKKNVSLRLASEKEKNGALLWLGIADTGSVRMSYEGMSR